MGAFEGTSVGSCVGSFVGESVVASTFQLPHCRSSRVGSLVGDFGPGTVAMGAFVGSTEGNLVGSADGTLTFQLPHFLCSFQLPRFSRLFRGPGATATGESVGSWVG